jgi:hypothetical protein
MKSTSHRKNILDADYTEIGVHVASGIIHGKNEKRFAALVEVDRMFFGKMAVQSYKELTKKFEAVLKEYDLLGVLIGSKVDPQRILRYVKETDYIKKGTI